LHANYDVFIPLLILSLTIVILIVFYYWHCILPQSLYLRPNSLTYRQWA
jgi:hypothetical protein